MGDPETKSFTWDEGFDAGVKASALVKKIIAAVNDMQLDGKITGKEMGDLLGAVGPELGALVDQVIEDVND